MPEKNTEDMTIEELRAYYDAGGANRVAAMDSAQQQDLFKQFLVSIAHLVANPFSKPNRKIKTNSDRRTCAKTL